MQDSGKYISSTEQIYGFLNYEQILARSVDRCLLDRAKANTGTAGQYFSSVQSLCMALVDIHGKPMRSEMVKYKDRILSNTDAKPNAIDRYDELFMLVTDILARHKMLFKSVMVEVGREQI